MAKIKIFLGSSTREFHVERLEMKNHVDILNEIYKGRGVEFELYLCENTSKAVSRNRKQDEHNNAIKSSQYAYFIAGQETGRYTREEFDVAWDHFKLSDEPIIHVYFVNYSSGSGTTQDFRNYIRSVVEHYPDNLDGMGKDVGYLSQIKLDLTMELIADAAVGGEIGISEGRLMLDGRDIMPVMDLPLFYANGRLGELNKEYVELAKELAILVSEIQSDGGRVVELMGELQAKSNRRDELAHDIEVMEERILDYCSLAAKKGRLGSEIDPREKAALELARSGDLDAADMILRDPLWDKQVEFANAMGDAAVRECRKFVSGRRLLIEIIKMKGVDKENEQEILDLYEQVSSYAEKWQVELGVLYDYAHFLFKQGRYTEAAKVGHRCELRYELVGDVALEDRAALLDLVGQCHHFRHKNELALAYHKRAIELYERLSDESPALYQIKLVSAYNHIASDYEKLKDFAERHASLSKAEELGSELADKDLLAYGPIVAGTFNRFGCYCNGRNRPKDSERYHEMSIEIRERLYESDPAKYANDLAQSYNNMAFLLDKQRRYAQAESYYRKAIAIRDAGSDTNPTLFLPKAALVRTNLANTLRKVGKYDEAEKVCAEAVEIREFFAMADRDSYAVGLSISLMRLGDILLDRGDSNRYGEAEHLFKRALEIRRDFAAEEPPSNDSGLAEILSSAADLSARMGFYQQAESMFLESVDLQAKYAKNDGGIDDVRLARCEKRYADFLMERARYDEAHELYSSALALLKLPAQANQEAFAPEVDVIRDRLCSPQTECSCF